MIINHDTQKKDLINDQMLHFFRTGVNVDGFWTNLHEKIQLEDVIYCLIHLYSSFDFMVLFDHSSGHTKIQKYA